MVYSSADSAGAMVGQTEPQQTAQIIPPPQSSNEQKMTATNTPQMAKGGLVTKSRSHPLNKFYGK